MSLCLTITSYHKITPGQCPAKTLDSGVMAIGRSSDNDWILPDPERLVSARHCVIQYKDGRYYLTDNSTNGVELVNAGIRLRRGNSEPLQDGEIIRIGEYEISARIDFSLQLAADGATAGVAANSFEALMAQAATPSSPAPASLPAAHFQGGSAMDTLPDLFDFLAPAVTPPATLADHVPAEQHDFRPPTPMAPVVVKTEAPAAAPGVIPEDWDLFADTPAVPAQPDAVQPLAAAFELPEWPVVAAPEPSTPFAAPVEAWPADVEPLPPLAEPLQAATAPLPPLAEPLQAATAPLPPLAESLQAATAPLPPLVEPLQAATASLPPLAEPRSEAPALVAQPELLKAFLRGAGLDHLRIATEQAEAQMEAIGRSYRLMVEGLIDVLRARSSLKGEFRMQQTMIRPLENNPLKFAPNADEALLLLLRHGNQAFMAPDQAVSDSFDDLRAHQLAVMAGVEAAIKHLLKRFEPAELEARMNKPGGLSNLFSGSRQSQYWQQFGELYTKISAEAEDDFQDLFGREFSRAYEAHSARLGR